jgi:two-component sensor histidine kinase
MNFKKAYILIIILINSLINTRAGNFTNIDVKNIPKLNSGRGLLQSWDSINILASKTNIPFKITDWEQKFEREYKKATLLKDDSLAFELSIPLSYIYHSETKFSKGIPILQNILEHKEKLDKETFKNILVKIEEEYRASNEIGDAINIRKVRIANNFINNYWEIYKDCGLFEAAKKDLLQFVPIPEKNTYRRLHYYFLLGDLYSSMKAYDSAKTAYEKGYAETIACIEFNKTSNSLIKEKLSYWETCFTGFITKCNIENGDYRDAIVNLKKDINNSIDNPDNKIEKMIVLSKCYIHLNQVPEAKQYLDSAKGLMVEKMSKPLSLDLLLNYAAYFDAIHKNDSALFYYKKYNNYKDTLYNKIQKNQSILLLVQLEVTNRRSELLKSNQSLQDSNKENIQQRTALLILLFFLLISIIITTAIYVNNIANKKSKNKIEAQNVLINAHSMKMESQFNHNETLLKELHHRVKNNLQVMYSLLNLQKRRNKDNDIIETLSSIQNRIQTMALVHQNLYISGDFELVEILNYIKTLATHLESIYKIDKQQIKVEFEIDENLKLPIETVVAIGLIVNEAVSNSFKYAFKRKKDNGILEIKIINTENEIEVSISDNGDGIQQKNNKENSLGMKLIDLMCLQLKATHTIENINGVKHLIKFNK